MEWHKAIEIIEPYIVSVSTPNGSGTGWLVSISTSTPVCAIATAAHVIDYAHYWELPIRITHPTSGKSLLLRAQDRAIHIESALDTAAIIFNHAEISFPTSTLPLMEKGYYLKPGVEIGWLGFPAIYKAGLSFFSGRISSYLEEEKRYYVDAVAINGVSGGPAFRLHVEKPELAGVVSAYIANRATGETLPGVAVVQDVTQFYDVAQRFRTLDEAKSKESPPAEPPPPKATVDNPSGATRINK